MKLLIVVFSIVTLLLQGCSTPRKAIEPVVPLGPFKGATQPVPETMGPPEVYGPPEQHSTSPDSAQAASRPMVMAPESMQKRSVVLVFGPGLARGYTYVGILRALKEQKIPVAAVFGTEMGGLIAALYGMSSNLNEFEWGLLKLTNDDNFLPAKSFFSRNNNLEATDGRKLEKSLRQIFGAKDLKEAKIPTKIALQSKATGIPIVVDHGSVAQVVRAALAAPSLFFPGTWSTQSGDIAAMSAASSRPYLVNEAKSLGLGPVIVIDVLSQDEGASAQSDLSNADLIIRPDVQGIDYLDFPKKTEAAFRGKNAVVQNLEAIRKITGSTGSGL